MREHSTLRRRTPRSGIAGAWVAVAFFALAGVASLVIDVGSLVVAAQRCQDVADSAALAAARRLPYVTPASQAALGTVSTNNSDAIGWPVTASNSDLAFYYPGDTVDGVFLGPWAHAVTVQVHGHVDYTFGRLLGIDGADAQRHGTAVRAPVKGIPLCPMWIAHNTPIDYTGQTPVNLLMADGPHYADIPGSFGFLLSPAGCTCDWFKLLQGYNLTWQDIETSFVQTGDTVYAKTGVTVGNWVKALVNDAGTSRYEQGTSGDWAGDQYIPPNVLPQNDNPRIMLIPLVRYLGDSGTNAAFRIESFAAFWLDGVNQGKKEIYGRFMYFDLPGGEPNPPQLKTNGIFATRLIG